MAGQTESIAELQARLDAAQEGGNHGDIESAAWDLATAHEAEKWAGVALHLQDHDCPLIVFTSSSGKSAALNIRHLATPGTIAASAIDEWLKDRQ